MGVFSSRFIGVDLYDNPLKAVEKQDGIIIDKSLKNIMHEIEPIEYYDGSKVEDINNRRYWGDFFVTSALLKYTMKAGIKLMKPRLMVCVPSDITHGPFGNLFTRMISEAGTTSGAREVFLIENIVCAAIGANLILGYGEKFPFIYANQWCTYMAVIFAGGILKARFIEKNYNDISNTELLENYEELKKALPDEMPEKYRFMKLKPEVREKIDNIWAEPLDNTINIAVPDEMKHKIGFSLGRYNLNYVHNYHVCIINGLEKVIQAGDSIKSSKMDFDKIIKK